MPTRPPVLLQSRKSAKAGLAISIVKTIATRAGRKNATLAGMPRNRGLTKLTSVRQFLCPAPARRRIGGISREASGRVNEDRAKVIDVGVGRSGGQEVAERFEKRRRVIVGKKGGRIEAAQPGSGRAGVVHEGAGRVGGEARA